MDLFSDALESSDGRGVRPGPGMTRSQVMDRIHDHVLVNTELIERYRQQGS
jgi:hypothetical protein